MRVRLVIFTLSTSTCSWRSKRSGIKLYSLSRAGYAAYESIGDIHSSKIVVRRLLDCWWDTTDTFQMCWGELTITPLDVSFISDLSFIGVQVSLGESLSFNTTKFKNLIGPVADTLVLGASYASRSTVAKGLITPRSSEEQKIRIVLAGCLWHVRHRRGIACFDEIREASMGPVSSVDLRLGQGRLLQPFV